MPFSDGRTCTYAYARCGQHTHQLCSALQGVNCIGLDAEGANAPAVPGTQDRDIGTGAETMSWGGLKSCGLK